MKTILQTACLSAHSCCDSDFSGFHYTPDVERASTRVWRSSDDDAGRRTDHGVEVAVQGRLGDEGRGRFCFGQMRSATGRGNRCRRTNRNLPNEALRNGDELFERPVRLNGL